MRTLMLLITLSACAPSVTDAQVDLLTDTDPVPDNEAPDSWSSACSWPTEAEVYECYEGCDAVDHDNARELGVWMCFEGHGVPTFDDAPDVQGSEPFVAGFLQCWTATAVGAYVEVCDG